MPTNPSIDLLSNRQPSIYYLEIGVCILPCSGSPQGVIAANRGSLALDVASGNAYLKTTNTANTGWVIIGSGGAGNPSPPNFSVQFNSGGVFLGDAEFLYNPTTNTLTLTGILNVTTINATDVNTTNSAITNATITNATITNLTTAGPITLTGFVPGRVLFVGPANEIDEDAQLTYDNLLDILTLTGEFVATTITNTGTMSTPALTLNSFSSGSVLFSGALGLVSEDNVNFSYDNPSNTLTLGGSVIAKAALESGIVSSVSGSVVLFASGAAFTTTIKSGDAPDASLVYKLPGVSPSSGQVLSASAPSAGVVDTSWITPGGGGSVWNTVFTPNSNQPPASNFATLNTRNSQLVLEYDASTNEDAVFCSVLSTDYASGGLTVVIYWAAASATSGDVVWNAAIERIDENGTDIDSDSFAAAQAVTATAPGTSGKVDYATITFTNGAQMDSLTAGESYRIKVTRDAAAGGDTMTGDAQIIRVLVRET